MIIVFGQRLYGKVDEVPGAFHVATRFAHIYYFPLIPMGSYVVFATDGKHFRGAKFGLNLKSVLVAWLIAGSITVGLIAAITAVVLAMDKNPWNAVPPTVVAIAAIAVLIVLLKVPGIRKATHARATAIANRIGATAEGQRAIDDIFQHPYGVGGAFPVIEVPQAQAVELIGETQEPPPMAMVADETVPTDDKAPAAPQSPGLGLQPQPQTPPAG